MFSTSRKTTSRRSIPIRQLAEYAADPKGYAKYRGKIRNKAAVKAGNRGEAAMGRTSSKLAGIIAAIVAGLVVLWLSR
jgi:hypothetical protein